MTHANDVAVGIVGLGGIGHHHAEKLTDRGANLVGGMDIDAGARRRFHEAFHVHAYEDEMDLYEACDAVLITTPNRFHEEYAVSALEAGLDVLLEKPLAHNLESAERIAEAAREAEGFCMVGFNNRFAEPVQVIKHYQAEGRFGETTHVEANYIRRRGVPGRGSWFTSKGVAGGGALIDIGVHAIDLALYFLDHPEVVEVTGETRSEFGGRDDYAFVHMWGDDNGSGDFDVEDSASAFIRGADGSTVSLEVAWATNRPTNDEFVVRGTEAGATFDRGNDDLTIHEATAFDGDQHHLSDTAVETREGNSHGAEQEAFLEAVAAGEAPTINTIDEALSVQRVIDAIYESSERGEAVRLD
ncbi:oxidoreductase domain protein [Halorubrum aidingense JCM 13560]|uniref:Oxidoreductase domain protein n=1 Tax=Halorubrum aidingense JCM 13560 TaxID=1230454 RepID=M0PC68_9EURY|nr:Gfo/Idh/MocA family oxidoreductase [Halorubrum aidingense]EMA67443.1 oxidoreductase domain protein [Halorubrum aidingense JCM 13560]